MIGPSEVAAYVALGVNLGDRLANLARARQTLARLEESRQGRTSRIWESRPAGRSDQPSFLNQVVELLTALSPGDLWAALARLERQLGRDRSKEVRWGPRYIDLDLLLYGDRTIDQPDLTVPHPRLLERDFALGLLTEVAPEVEVPGTGLRTEELWARWSGPRHLICPVEEGS